MNDAQKVEMLRTAVQGIRELTFKPDQEAPVPTREQVKQWAAVQSIAARVLRKTK